MMLATKCVLRILFQFVLINNKYYATSRAASCYRPSSVVCLIVCQSITVTLVSPATTAEAIEMPPEFTSQMASRSVQPFLQGSRFDRQTDEPIDRQTTLLRL